MSFLLEWQAWDVSAQTKGTRLNHAEASILRWSLSRPVTTCVSPSHAELLWCMIDAEKEMTPLTPDDEEAIALSTDVIAPIFATQH